MNGITELNAFANSLEKFIFPTISKTSLIIRDEFSIEHIKVNNNPYHLIFGHQKSNKNLINHVLKNHGFKINHRGSILHFNKYIHEGLYYSDCNLYLLSLFSRWKDGFISIQVLELKNKKLTIYSSKETKEKPIENSYFNSLSKLLVNKKLTISNRYEKKLYITNYDYPHIGHNLWNGLSGWSELNKDDLENITNNSCTVKTKVKSSLFPIKKPGDMELEDAIKLGYFPLHLKNNYISRELINKNIIIEKPSVYSNRHSILISLRTGNRSALNQFEFIKSYICKVTNIINDIDIILDGMNVSEMSYSNGSHSKIDKNEDYILAEKIKEHFKGTINVTNIVGCSIKENLKFASQVSHVLAPWGAGLSKTSWILDKPTFCYSNQLTLTKKPDLHIYDDEKFVECKNKITFLHSDLVLDVGSEKYRNNFYLLDGSSDAALQHTLNFLKRP